MYDPWQRDVTDLQGEMNMVCHTAECMDAKTEPCRPFMEQKIEATPIGLVEGFARHRLRREENVYMSNLTHKNCPFLLSCQALPLLIRAAEEEGEARIVNVASAAQRSLDFGDLQLEEDYDGMRAYSQSKLALVIFSFDLADQLEASGISVNALHPASLMDTKMVREWFGTPRTGVDEGAAVLERLVLTAELPGSPAATLRGSSRRGRRSRPTTNSSSGVCGN